MPSLEFQRRSILDLPLVPRDTNSTNSSACFNSSGQPISCPPVFSRTTFIIVITVLVVFAAIVLGYISWRYYQRRMEEKAIKEEMRQLTVLQNQSIREMREAMNNSKNYRRIASEEYEDDSGLAINKPLPTPNKSIFRKLWR